MYSVFFLLALMSLPAKVELDKLDISGTSISVFEVDKNLLVTSNSEDALVLVNPNGETVAAYRKKGLGSDEIKVPTVLMVDGRSIYVLSNNQRILVFDHKLNLVGKPMLPIPTQLQKGLVKLEKRDDDMFLVVDNAFSKGQFYVYELAYDTSSGWTQKRSWNNRTDTYSTATVGNSLLFLFNAWIYNNVEAYSIQAFPEIPSFGQKPVVTLSGSTEEFQPLAEEIPIKAAVNGVVKTKDGFIVEVGSFRSTKPGDLEMYWDTFDLAGNFINRESVGQLRIIPVGNGPGAYTFDPNVKVLQLLE